MKSILMLPTINIITNVDESENELKKKTVNELQLSKIERERK
jgi:hypothetical protein